MKQIIALLISNNYYYNKQENAYSFTNNTIRHFAEIDKNTIRMYSCPEGTDGETCLIDTGVLQLPSLTLVKEIIQKQKNLNYE